MEEGFAIPADSFARVVVFALSQPDDVHGPGNGFVDVFDATGQIHLRLISRGALNSPWGMAFVPPSGDEFAARLLVGNFGDGRINAFSLDGTFLGQLKDSSGGAVPNAQVTATSQTTKESRTALTDGNGQFVFETVAQSAACNRLHVIEQRCARWLLMSQDRVGRNRFDLTQEFLAEMLGVRRPGVTVATSEPVDSTTPTTSCPGW